jgi:hypothetical protein
LNFLTPAREGGFVSDRMARTPAFWPIFEFFDTGKGVGVCDPIKKAEQTAKLTVNQDKRVRKY